MNIILQLLMFSNFWMSIIWRGMQIEESVIRRPFFWWLSCSTDVIFFISKVSSKIVNNSWLWSGISQDVEPIRNGEIFWINDKIYWPRTVFFRHVNWSRDLIMYMFPIFFLAFRSLLSRYLEMKMWCLFALCEHLELCDPWERSHDLKEWE